MAGARLGRISERVAEEVRCDFVGLARNDRASPRCGDGPARLPVPTAGASYWRASDVLGPSAGEKCGLRRSADLVQYQWSIDGCAQLVDI